MLRSEGPKTLALAGDIVKIGTSPTERLAVMVSPTERGRYLVLEGNRRLTALRILAEPSLADGQLLDPDIKRLKGWAHTYAGSPIKDVECVVFGSRDDAAPWIERRHKGQQGGVGVVPWGNLEQERFDERRTGKSSPALQVLDYVASKANLDAQTRESLSEIKLTNLQRLIADGKVRTRLGIDLQDGTIVTQFPEREVLKGLTKVVIDVASNLKVTDIYNAADRKAYLDTFGRHDLPAGPRPKGPSRVLVVEGQGSGGGTVGQLTKRHGGRSAGPRPYLAPKTCQLTISLPKIRKIFRELQMLRVDDTTNACAVLFRVFIELTVDQYVTQHKLLVGGESAPLAKKLSTTARHLVSSGGMTSQEAKPVLNAADDKHVFGANVVTFHQYVHNRYISPTPTDLRAAWDNLQPFFEKVWP
jgi:hypothetical protein